MNHCDQHKYETCAAQYCRENQVDWVQPGQITLMIASFANPEERPHHRFDGFQKARLALCIRHPALQKPSPSTAFELSSSRYKTWLAIDATKNANTIANKIIPPRKHARRCCSVRVACDFWFMIFSKAGREPGTNNTLRCGCSYGCSYSTTGGVSNVWNGGGLGSVHSRPSAPSHGLSPASRWFSAPR